MGWFNKKKDKSVEELEAEVEELERSIQAREKTVELTERGKALKRKEKQLKHPTLNKISKAIGYTGKKIATPTPDAQKRRREAAKRYAETRGTMSFFGESPPGSNPPGVEYGRSRGDVFGELAEGLSGSQDKKKGKKGGKMEEVKWY